MIPHETESPISHTAKHHADKIHDAIAPSRGARVEATWERIGMLLQIKEPPANPEQKPKAATASVKEP